MTEVPRGLGVTAFVGEGDSQRRVNSGEKLKNSDHVRLLVETAATGYLYAFQQRDDGLAEMIFPEPTPLGSAHLVQAYQLTEIPVRGWLQFGDKASSEHIHLVLAATPLTDADVTLHVHSTSEGPQPRKAPIARHLEREKLERLQAAGAPFSTDEGGEYGMRRTGQEEAGKYLLDIDARPHLIVMVAPGPHLRDWIVATVAIDHR